jgi:hypothetical protein
MPSNESPYRRTEPKDNATTALDNGSAPLAS